MESAGSLVGLGVMHDAPQVAIRWLVDGYHSGGASLCKFISAAPEFPWRHAVCLLSTPDIGKIGSHTRRMDPAPWARCFRRLPGAVAIMPDKSENRRKIEKNGEKMR
jgi:hypothetical protein